MQINGKCNDNSRKKDTAFAMYKKIDFVAK